MFERPAGHGLVERLRRDGSDCGRAIEVGRRRQDEMTHEIGR